jgi:hypothetical protein
MGGAVEGADLLAELVDLAGPAGLVGFLAVLGEAGALERGGEFGLQLSDVTGGEGSRRHNLCGCGTGEGDWPLEEAVDPGNAAAVPVAALQFGAQFEAGDGATLGAQLVDDPLDLGVGQAGRAGHKASLMDYGK